jgi:hypothetical protein
MSQGCSISPRWFVRLGSLCFSLGLPSLLAAPIRLSSADSVYFAAGLAAGVGAVAAGVGAVATAGSVAERCPSALPRGFHPFADGLLAAADILAFAGQRNLGDWPLNGHVAFASLNQGRRRGCR